MLTDDQIKQMQRDLWPLVLYNPRWSVIPTWFIELIELISQDHVSMLSMPMTYAEYLATGNCDQFSLS